MADELEGLLLGKTTPVVDTYSPELLFPIPRSQGRAAIGVATPLPFHGADIWHAYEVSWLNDRGVPQVRVGKFRIPCESPNLVESKSFKLYLNSLNSTRYASEEAVCEVIVRDVSAAAGARVYLELLGPDNHALAGTSLEGSCIDDAPIDVVAGEPDPTRLKVGQCVIEERLYSHLLRSLCPVTGQPDWATVWIDYTGPTLDRTALLEYIVAYRNHQEFHEQCVERMFIDILAHCRPQRLQIQAFYTRRGGMDINPFRSTEAGAQPLPRLNRQ
ncbi:NADPH-dependent 7-cyano-7-deazaguanine reductase QueF [Halioglobus japonicus]|uniref:NADPH-dependent 7-cyano-7-deazaguanine reductase n=1 Tax=Halioglobus japonicus TaxID=930805 RepID=A0AAP8SNQ8_9GAMM|nr:NADPH-dependent 7-cyano-7-deazaguanine reductase QueF [Halioglobus japonicus]AQA18857.1 NADPH-dependent 7-cyano-7-deazaguanine reductase QueF [Halioglobus japonicus]PLW86895.1 NADPH-dependent 7-cyano-7-deazaguanine reductase QueF [Halioglobus japonicus]GHD23484.1 NADPH-dependent 7-cyano-7-deazaguanine reductase [Halioglobus japonicus]